MPTHKEQSNPTSLTFFTNYQQLILPLVDILVEKWLFEVCFGTEPSQTLLIFAFFFHSHQFLIQVINSLTPSLSSCCWCFINDSSVPLTTCNFGSNIASLVNFWDDQPSIQLSFLYEVWMKCPNQRLESTFSWYLITPFALIATW